MEFILLVFLPGGRVLKACLGTAFSEARIDSAEALLVALSLSSSVDSSPGGRVLEARGALRGGVTLMAYCSSSL